MSRLFESAKKGVSDKEKQDFIVDQRSWLKQRNISCNIKRDTPIPTQELEEKKTCLKNLYHERINGLKTSSSDERGSVVTELASRIRTASNKSEELDLSNLFFSKPYDIQRTNGKLKKFGTGEEVIKTIMKQYVLTKSQIAEISKFAKHANGVSLYLEDVDQDGIKDVIINTTGGTLICNRYMYYHANSDKTMTRMNGPDPSRFDNEGGICRGTSLGFVHLNKKTYIAVVDDYLHSGELKPKTNIELFSMKNEKDRKGIGKIQVNYNSQFTGKLLKGDNPAFHVLEEKADALARHFAQNDSPPLATSLMNNPAWAYRGKDAEKISKLIVEKYLTDEDMEKEDVVRKHKARPVRELTTDFLKNDSRYQLLDIDNDGKNEIVCYLVYKSDNKKYNRMIIVKMGTSDPVSYIDVDKYYPEVATLDNTLFKEFCNIFFDLKFKGSEYFPLSDGKENYIVKIGIGWRGNHFSDGYILGIYKLKGGKIELVDAMSINPELTFKDVTVLK